MTNPSSLTTWLALIFSLAVSPAAHADSSAEERALDAALAAAEQHIASGKLDYLAAETWHLFLMIELDDAGKLHPKYPNVVQRYRALGALAAKAAGGHSAEIVGDGTPVAPDDDKQKLHDEVLAACEVAAKTGYTTSSSDKADLAANYKKYEKALDRVLKGDPSALRVSNGQFALLQCEWKINQFRMQLDDTTTREDSAATRYKTCGYNEYRMGRLKTGSHEWGPWGQVMVLTADTAVALDCKKHPTRDSYPAAMKAAIHDAFTVNRGDIVATAGAAWDEQHGREIYQYQELRIYSKETSVATTNCGSKDTTIVCEAAGSTTTRAFNELSHDVERAEVHRAAGRADNCKEMYEQAHKASTAWTAFYDDAIKTGAWVKGLKYQTAKDGLLSEAQIIAKVKELGALADRRSIGSYCKK